MSNSQRIALVTGANKGIGKDVVRQLASEGLTVLLAARNRQLGEAAAAELQGLPGKVLYVKLDLDDDASISAAAATVERDYGQLDILVNNAGIVQPGDELPSKADPAAVQRTLEVNLIGALKVTQAFLPLLHKSASARIVNVSSGLGSLTLHSDPNWEYAAVKYVGYCSSKAALNMFTVALAWELRDSKIKVNAVNPGYTATDLNQHQGHLTVAEGAAPIVRMALIGDDGPTGGHFEADGVVPW